MNQLLLLTNRNVTRSMRSVNKNKWGKRNRVLYLESKIVSVDKLDETKNEYPYIAVEPFEVLESKLNLQNNNLEKENVSLLRGIPHIFNKPMSYQWSVI